MAKFKLITRVAKKARDKCKSLTVSIELLNVMESDQWGISVGIKYLVDGCDIIEIHRPKYLIKDTNKSVDELAERLGYLIANNYRVLKAEHYHQFRVRFHKDRLEMIKELELAFGREGVKVPERIITYKLISEKTLNNG